MKMTEKQYAVWTIAVHGAGKWYNDLLTFIDCLESADTNSYYTLENRKSWLDDLFPEFFYDKRRFVRVWLGDERIEVVS